MEPKDIKTPAEFKAGQFIQLKTGFNYGCRKGYVYQITRVNGDYIVAAKMGKGYKNMLTGNIAGNSFNVMSDRLKNWIEKGAISFVELTEVTKTEEYTSTVRRPKKQTGISTEIVEDNTQQANDKQYTITKDIDTRDNSDLWVVKFVDRMDREEYKETANAIKTIGGYYSKFKKGFIFKEDPAEKLDQLFGSSTTQEAEPQENEEEATTMADYIVDTSTEIIAKLHMPQGNYIYDSEYKKQMAEFVKQNISKITQLVISKIPFKDLRLLVEKINEEAA